VSSGSFCTVVLHVHVNVCSSRSLDLFENVRCDVVEWFPATEW